MDFTFKNRKNGKIITVTLADRKIREYMEDDARELMGCDCQPIGETNFIECNCSDYYDEFDLINK